MPSLRHEVLVELCRKLADLLVQPLRDRLGPLDASRLRFETDDVTLSQLTQLHADLVLRVLDSCGRLLCVLVVEVQLSEKATKPRSWVGYHGGIFARFGCPTFVIVVTVDPDVAAWAAGPFDTGMLRFRPIVIGPSDIPIITDLDRARGRPELVLLSGLAHSDDPDIDRIGRCLWSLLDHCDDDQRLQYWDVFLDSVSESTRRNLMALHGYVPRTPCLRKIYDDGVRMGSRAGVLEGEALALIEIAEDRGMSLSPEQWATIVCCDHRERIRRWRSRIVTATSLDQVFDD